MPYERIWTTKALLGFVLFPKVLSHWGRHFSPPDSGMFRVDPGLYQLSDLVAQWRPFFPMFLAQGTLNPKP